MVEQQKSADKRSYPRIPREVAIEVKRLEYPLPEAPGGMHATKDIAVGGLCFAAPTRYEAGAVLSLKIELKGWRRRHRGSVSAIVNASAATAPLTTIAEVIWAKPSSTGAGYDIGVKFINIYSDDLDALKQYFSKISGPV